MYIGYIFKNKLKKKNNNQNKTSSHDFHLNSLRAGVTRSESCKNKDYDIIPDMKYSVNCKFYLRGRNLFANNKVCNFFQGLHI